MTRMPKKRPFYLSMRWRVLLPVIVVVALSALIGTFVLSNRAATDEAATGERILLQTAQAIGNRSVTLYERQRTEAQRIAYTDGIAQALVLGDAGRLQISLTALAAAADLDAVLIAAADGREVAGVSRAADGDYTVSTGADLRGFPALDTVLVDGAIGVSALLQSDTTLLLTVAVPLMQEGAPIGAVLVGQDLAQQLAALQATPIAELAVFAADGTLQAATFDALAIDAALVDRALAATTPVLESQRLDSGLYQVAYAPFVYGDATLGLLATFLPDSALSSGLPGRQWIALFTISLTALVLIAVFVAVNRSASQGELVANTAEALAAGFDRARTGLQAEDEIGRVGAALDHYAQGVQVREDWFRTQLQRQRRHSGYLLAVLESLPDGVIVQDRDGAVMMMNDQARVLLGSLPDFQADLARIESKLPQVWGQALAPGIYTLGDPQQLERDGRVLSLQAAAVLSPVKVRIGTVLVLRDISAEVQAQQKQSALLDQLSENIQEPLQTLAQTSALRDEPLTGDFAREIARHAASLQKMIVDMREVTRYSPQQAHQMQRPLLAETLIYAVANDWRQIAQAANLELRLELNVIGQHILGDESRLRWALGNLVDNAIKYTPAGGVVALELQTIKQGMLYLRVRDNGVGISRVDLDNLFMPFYRGTPTDATGAVIQVPGMGQGLPLAQQIISAHGGQMKVKSREGVGTAVVIALPLTSAEGYGLPLNIKVMEGETVMITSVRR